MNKSVPFSRCAEIEWCGKFPCFASAQDWRLNLFSELVNQVLFNSCGADMEGEAGRSILRLR